ncbi:MAG: hypothetical protein K0R99_2888 [Microbacterium sp.]|uniref:acyltransferase family protein n=1 Tax=Microbacterium sp. TaxID=51671 RepID=UPI0026345390|nr:acyltransferase [Microbacterium sp.]MDF2561442.1 hypothetical protein [Microbacterium sp.]
MGESQRLPSLDGLRGIAAVIVLIHHALLTFPVFADSYYEMSDRGEFSVAWMLSYTPLHAFWAGEEAVYLFFVLSGIVLVLPVMRAGRRFSWLSYYPRRFVRLYLPLVAAIALGVLLVFLFPRTQDPDLGAWMNARRGPYTLTALFEDVTLLFGPSGIISPLWSLKWEVAFSLMLPIFVLLAVVARKLWWLKLVGIFGLIFVGSVAGSTFLFFLPIFAVGTLLISEWDRVTRGAHRLDQTRWGWPATIVLAAILTTFNWCLLGFGAPESILSFTGWVPVAGVALFVVIGAFYSPTRRFLESRPVAWLGTISFSLYLVHEPMLISARLATFPASPWVGIAIAVPVAFLVAWLFAKYVEQPSHRLSKWVGARSDSMFSRGTTQSPNEPRIVGAP